MVICCHTSGEMTCTAGLELDTNEDTIDAYIPVKTGQLPEGLVVDLIAETQCRALT
jgi:hypothetical protein